MTKHALPYAQMSVSEIISLPVRELSEDQAHLYLWTTNRYLRSAFDIVEQWSFTYRQTLIWRKTGCPTPFGGSIAPNHCEYLLFARRGTLPLLGRLKSNVIDAPQQQEHSRKPDVFIDLVEQISPGPYLELFARRQRLGWDTWGFECFNSIEVTA